jgi:hypothetical protein
VAKAEDELNASKLFRFFCKTIKRKRNPFRPIYQTTSRVTR